MQQLFFARYPIPPEDLRAERYERVRAFCAAHGLDALLAFAADSVSKRGAVRFLSNYPTTTQASAVLFPRSGEPVLLLTYITHLHWARETTWLHDVQLCPGFASGLREVAAARGVATGRIGVVGGEYLSTNLLAAVKAALSRAAWIPVDEEFSSIRQRKTASDLRLLAETGRIADAGFAAVASTIRPGVTEPDLFGAIEHVLWREGAEGGLVLLGTGPRHNMPLPVPRPLARGDVVRVSIEPCGPGGFMAQFVRVYSIGRARSEVREKFAICRAIQEAAAAALVPGQPIRDAAESALTLLRTAGSLRDEVALGHGMGLDLSEPPRLHPADPTVLAEDMVITVHPGIYYEDFGIFVGDTYHIGASGPARLSAFPQDLVEV